MPYFHWPLVVLALPVIPTLRLTNRGMVNSLTQEFVPVQVSGS
jgi:adenine deaminase